MGKIFNKGLSEDDKKEGILKRLENIKDKNEKILSTFSTTNRSSRNKINNADDIKKLSLDSMFSLMREYHKKITSLKNLVPRTQNNKELKKEILNNAGDYYNELYYIYKNKYNEIINGVGTKNRIKLDYKKIRTC